MLKTVTIWRQVETVQSLVSLKARVMDTAEEIKKGAVSRAQQLVASAKTLKSNTAQRLTDAKGAAGASYAKLRKDADAEFFCMAAMW